MSFQAHSMETDDLGDLGYWLYAPENPTENMPLIVYLHGASGRGKDLNLVVADEDFPKYLQAGDCLLYTSSSKKAPGILPGAFFHRVMR